MIVFNIDGVGVLDLDADTSVALKKENEQYNWAEPRTGRTAEFSVPATLCNRKLLGFSDDPVEYGSAMRVRHRCQMQYPAGAVDGRLDVTKYDGGRFSCVFYYPFSDAMEALDGLKLADCRCTFKGIAWDGSNAIDADDPQLPARPLAIIRYDGSIARYTGAQRYSWLPSVNAKAYIEDILDGLGVSHSLNVSSNIYLVSPTINGGTEVTGVVTKSGLTAGTIAPALQNYFEFGTDAYLVRNGFLNIPVHTPCWSIRPKMDLNVTFPDAFPSTYELIHVSGNKTTFVGGYYRDGGGWHGNPLAGRTVDLKAGQSFFIVEDLGSAWGDGYVNGWTSDVSPFSFTFTVARSGDISIGDTWKIQDNAPDMTVVEFLQSIALLEGKELFFDSESNRVVIAGADIGSAMRAEIGDVIELVSVSRTVDYWGQGTRSVLVAFDSEDYVSNPLSSSYVIDNDTLDGEEERKIGWSEGRDSGNGSGDVFVDDVDFGGDTPTVKATKWTVGLSGTGTYLKRAALATYDANATIAMHGTCVTLRIVQDIADFLAITRDAYFTWRGAGCVWTSAEWSGGVTTITLQVY